MPIGTGRDAEPIKLTDPARFEPNIREANHQREQENASTQNQTASERLTHDHANLSDTARSHQVGQR
jgi:hypothetical protein